MFPHLFEISLSPRDLKDSSGPGFGSSEGFGDGLFLNDLYTSIG